MLENKTLRVLVADPHAIVCAGLEHILSRQPDIKVVGQARCARQAIDLFTTHRPDVLVMERDFPDVNGQTVMALLHDICPSACILILSAREDEEAIYTALRAGAKGYLFKDADGQTIIDAIRLVYAGAITLAPAAQAKLVARVARTELTRREKEILQHITVGESNLEIAGTLFIAEGTVKSHINTILAKLEVTDRTQAAIAAIRRGLVKLT